jgi:hypothetical protein
LVAIGEWGYLTHILPEIPQGTFRLTLVGLAQCMSDVKDDEDFLKVYR